MFQVVIGKSRCLTHSEPGIWLITFLLLNWNVYMYWYVLYSTHTHTYYSYCVLLHCGIWNSWCIVSRYANLYDSIQALWICLRWLLSFNLFIQTPFPSHQNQRIFRVFDVRKEQHLELTIRKIAKYVLFVYKLVLADIIYRYAAIKMIKQS